MNNNILKFHSHKAFKILYKQINVSRETSIYINPRLIPFCVLFNQFINTHHL